MMRIPLIFSSCLFIFVFAGAGHAVPKQTLLYNAEELLKHIKLGNTDYRHKEQLISWGDKHVPYQSYTDCSGFINALIKKTYDSAVSLKLWLGKSRPLAVQYFNVIISENHFTRINQISEILPGDLIVIKYADRSEHEDNTGHCMLVEEIPYRIDPLGLLEPGLFQYAIRVIDSSKSPHGKEDSRHTGDGHNYSGLGKGIFRLYADAQGRISGYSWSLEKPLPGFDPLSNLIVVGRINL